MTVAGGRVFFGSSVDFKVYAVSARTGKVKWTFHTDGPVRFAPTIWKNRVYVGSDDGYVYCLNARSGRLLWKYRAGPGDERVLGNENMVSLWPVRTSVLVDDGVAYSTAGVFPYEGIYISALDARTGVVIWKNDTIGDRAHELHFNGISPHGYLIASENVLYVPSGRALPAAFDRNTGEFLYYMSPSGKSGGTWALLEEDRLVAGVDLSGVPRKVGYDIETGAMTSEAYAFFPGIDLITAPDVSYVATLEGIFALNREQYSDAERRAGAMEEEKQELGGTLRDLRSRLAGAGIETSRRINEQIEEIAGRISSLTDEQEAIKSSSFEWEYPCKDLCSLILAGDMVIAGGKDFVIGIDAGTGGELWSADVDGRVLGLAVYSRRLFASTDKGNNYCFKEGGAARAREVRTDPNPFPFREGRLLGVYQSAVREIVRETGIEKGYCLVLGARSGKLAFELARQTDLRIVCIDRHKRNVRRARDKFDEAGLLGSRIAVGQWDLSSLPDYFANLIVSEEILESKRISYPAEEVFRVLRPYGGVAYFGQPAVATGILRGVDFDDVKEWLEGGGIKGGGITGIEEVERNGVWAKVIRGELAGAGGWTQQYGNPQNTACSGDELVGGQLGVLWFGEPGPKGILERHAKASSPVALNGLFFKQGEEIIAAYDSYNGTLLWERKIPGAVRARADVDCGNLALTDDGLYVAAHGKCYRLDPATGETIRIYEIPKSIGAAPRRWGFISCTGGVLYGSMAMPLKEEYGALWDYFVDNGKWRERQDVPVEYLAGYDRYRSRYPVPDENMRMDFQRAGTLWRPITDFPDWENYNPAKGAVTDRIIVSDVVFALDTETGELLWSYRGRRIANITITIGEGRIFFAESAITGQQKQRAISDRRELGRRGIYVGAEGVNAGYDDLDVRTVVCLDAVSGEKEWERTIDLTGCCGDAMASSYNDGMLLFFGNVGCHDAWRYQQDQLKYRRVAALSAQNGEVRWSHPLNYRVRPVIMGNEIIIEPRACDLYTGGIKMRSHPITGEEVEWEFLRPGHTCAMTAASASALFYRSGTIAIYDIAGDRGLALFGAIRPGCLINTIPANGVLIYPEASSGCTCSFPIRGSFVLKHKPERPQPWTVYITQGEMTPVEHFAINFGAPSDMKDDEGTVWFSYPNARTDLDYSWTLNHFPGYGVKFDLQDEITEGMGYFCRDFKGRTVNGSERPWLFTSGCLGMLECSIPLTDGEDASPGTYTVRLGFMAQPGDRRGRRVFDIELQGDTVLENFDILRAAGSPNTAVVREFNGIRAEDHLVLKLIPEKPDPDMRKAPLINFIEIIRE